MPSFEVTENILNFNKYTSTYSLPLSLTIKLPSFSLNHYFSNTIEILYFVYFRFATF